MDFSLTDELSAVRDLTAQILSDLSTPERLAALDGGVDDHAWQQLAQAGLLGLALPPDAGGGGLGFVAAHLVLTEIGRAAAPVPYWETVVLGALPLAAFGSEQQRAMLDRVVAGDVFLTAALTDEGPGDPHTPRTRATGTGGGWELTGVKTGVPLGALAHRLLVSAATEDGAVGVWVVDPASDGVTVQPQATIGGTLHAEVALDRVHVTREALLGGLDGAALDWLLDHAAAGIASLTAGLCAGALRLAADYTSSREQFGRPVATFQAVAQRMADAYIDAEGCSLTALEAAWRLSEGLPARDHVAIARWWAAEAGHRVLHASSHVHGGVGVDRDYPLARYFAMTKQLEFSLGAGTTHLLRLGASIAAEPV